MTALIRTRVGPFELSQSIPLEQLSADNLPPHLQPCAAVVSHLPAYVCDASEIDRLSHGCGILPRDDGWRTSILPKWEARPTDSFALLDASGQLLAVGAWNRVRPELRPRINLAAKNAK